MVTASTVGFGDLYPGVYANSSCPDAPVTFSRIFTVVYIFLGIGVVFAQVSSLIAQLFRPIFRRLNNFLLTAVNSIKMLDKLNIPIENHAAFCAFEYLFFGVPSLVLDCISFRDESLVTE